MYSVGQNYENAQLDKSFETMLKRMKIWCHVRFAFSFHVLYKLVYAYVWQQMHSCEKLENIHICGYEWFNNEVDTRILEM